MRVFIVTGEPFPNGMAATGRITCYAKALLSAGIYCEVVVCRRTEVFGKTPKNIISEGSYEGVNFKYIAGTPLRDSNKMCRFCHDMRDRHRTILYLKSRIKSGDSILCYMREDPFAKRLQRFAHANGVKIVRDLCEYPFASLHLTAKTENRCDKYMRTTFRGFDGAICISQSLLNLAVKYYPQGSYVKIPIMIDEDKWNLENVSPVDIGRPYIFHSGTLLQQKDGILDVLQAFAEALPSLPKGVKYLFSGDVTRSADKIRIQEIIETYNLQSSVRFLGYLSRGDLQRYMKGAKLFIIYKNDNLQNRYCFATKLGEYLLSGNPVITTTVGEPKFFLHDKKDAYLVPSGNIALLAKTIVEVFADDKSVQVGLNGRKTAINNFTSRFQGPILRRYIENL